MMTYISFAKLMIFTTAILVFWLIFHRYLAQEAASMLVHGSNPGPLTYTPNALLVSPPCGD